MAHDLVCEGCNRGFEAQLPGIELCIRCAWRRNSELAQLTGTTSRKHYEELRVLAAQYDMTVEHLVIVGICYHAHEHSESGHSHFVTRECLQCRLRAQYETRPGEWRQLWHTNVRQIAEDHGVDSTIVAQTLRRLSGDPSIVRQGN